LISKSHNASSTAATKNLELSDDLKKLGFSKVVVPLNGVSKNLIIVHNNIPAIATLDIHNWPNTDKSIKTALSNNGIDNQTIEKFMVFLSQEYVKVMEEAGANASKEKEDNEKKVYHMQKYSDTTMLAESVLVGGIPMFIVSERNGGTSRITVTDCIDLENKIIKPLKESAYLNRPYSFASSDQINELIETAKHDTPASLYRKVNAFCNKYIKEDDNHRRLLSADIIFTHFQDILGVTHYLFFVGGPDSGKSTNLSFIEVLAYRNFMNTDITPANVYRFLGQYEQGQGTLSFDEAKMIAESNALMNIFNSGYTSGKKVARIDVDNNGDQNGYYTYCFKAFAAEELSDSEKARAFNTRCIPLKCTPGLPDLDITEILNPAGDEDDQKTLVELMDLRNLLFAFRLLHFHDRFPNIKNLSLKNREKQLFKSLLRLFQGTDVSEEISEMVSYYVSKRREVNKSTLYAFVYRCIRQVIKEQTKEPHGLENANVIESDRIWRYVKSNLDGNETLSRPQSFQSIDFGEISQKYITQILKEVFGATPSKRHGQGRKLVFDLNKLDRFENLYGIEKAGDGDVNSGTGNSFFGSEQNDNEEESVKSDGTHGTLGTDSGKEIDTSESQEKDSSQDGTHGTLGTDSGKEIDTSESQEKDSSQDGTHGTGGTHCTGELDTTEKDESSHRGTDRTDGAYSEEKPHPIEEATTQINAGTEPANKNDSEESQINNDSLTSQNDQKSHEHSNNVSQASQASQLIERQGSTTSGPPIDQNFQDRILVPKETTFSSKNYEKSSIIPPRRTTEGIAPVKEVIIDGIPPIPCLFCNNFRTSIELDLRIHLSENHRIELVKLPIGKGDMEYRINYAVEEFKKRIVLMYDV
jgi:hypothetical protein